MRGVIIVETEAEYKAYWHNKNQKCGQCAPETAQSHKQILLKQTLL